MSNVERAAGVLIDHTRLDIGHCHCGWGVDAGNIGQSHALHVAQALADAGIIPRGEAEVTVEWGYRSYEGHVIRCASEQIAVEMNEAGRGLAFATQGVVQRTVSEWTEADDG